MTEQLAQLSMIEEIKQIALDQLGDWLGVDPVRQPAAIHHWQEVYDFARDTAEWERTLLHERNTLRFQRNTFRRLLHDVDQCAPPNLDVWGNDPLRDAIDAIRDELEES